MSKRDMNHFKKLKPRQTFYTLNRDLSKGGMRHVSNFLHTDWYKSS